MKKTYLLWCDLETTGLDESKDQILEAAFMLTDYSLQQVKGTDSVVRLLSWREPLIMPDVVVGMHVKNGLLSDLLAAKANKMLQSIAELEGAVLAEVCKVRDFGDVVLAGSTPHFDRKFMRAKMGILDSTLHYRHFDVSTLKAGYRNWLGKPDAFEVEEAHRAFPDLLDSLSVARKFRSMFLDFGSPINAQEAAKKSDLVTGVAQPPPKVALNVDELSPFGF